jgi:hypothetical protein
MDCGVLSAKGRFWARVSNTVALRLSPLLNGYRYDCTKSGRRAFLAGVMQELVVEKKGCPQFG